jgi:hypothetical protein
MRSAMVDALEQRMNEQEIIILEQREELIRFERENKQLADNIKFDFKEKDNLIERLGN